MPDLLNTAGAVRGAVGGVVGGAIGGVEDAVASVFAGSPTAPPSRPSPTGPPPPSEPPSAPPATPPQPPLIICPPMAPPPFAPPSFEVWAAQVPRWFWLMFVFTFLVAFLGAAAIGYILRELRRQRKGERLPKEETLRALAQLEQRLGRRGL